MSNTATRQIPETNQAGLIDRYIEAWNETDEANRRQLVSQIWTTDSSYVDPLTQAQGHDGIDAMIAGVQQQFAGLRFRRVTEVDGHNHCVRFGWELGPESGPAVAGGVDFGTISEDGLLRTIVGFLDYSPYPKKG
jgi:hypothetical protein